MSNSTPNGESAPPDAPIVNRRTWLLGLDPFFEARRPGKRAANWDAEDELKAVALLGDVSIDLSQAHSTPAKVVIDAWAVFRDVDVVVADGTHVELDGGRVWGDLSNETIPKPDSKHDQIVEVHGHSLFGDITVRPKRATI